MIFLARLRLAPVRETMFPSRAPFFRDRLSPRAAEIAAWAEEKERGNLPVSPFAPSPSSSAKGRPMSFVELTGHAKLDRRTKNLVKRLSADDIAIIDHTDLDRVSAEALLESGVRVVVNVADVAVRALPEPGSARARARRYSPHRRRRRRHLRRRARGRASDCARRRALPQRHCLAAGRVLEERELEAHSPSSEAA